MNLLTGLLVPYIGPEIPIFCTMVTSDLAKMHEAVSHGGVRSSKRCRVGQHSGSQCTGTVGHNGANSAMGSVLEYLLDYSFDY